MFDTGKELVHLSDGSYCSQDLYGVVEKIRNYDDTLDVLYLDPDKFPDMTDAPYIIVKKQPDGRQVRIFSCWELNEEVYQRLLFADTFKQDVLKMMDDHNRKLQKEIDAKRDEVLSEAGDQTKHLLANSKTTYKLRNAAGELVTIEDDKGVVKRQ
jgi:hypothetical protein